MKPLKISKQAMQDIESIGLYIALHDLAAAGRVVRRIEAAMRRLSLLPSLGRERPDIRPGVRMLVIDQYLILYRQTAEAVEIMRCVDGRRDLKEIL